MPSPRLSLVLALAALAVVLGVWWLSPLRHQLDLAAIGQTVEALRQSRAGMAGVVVAFALAAAAGLPVTALIASVAAAFGAATSVGVSLLGVAGSSAIGFGVGRLLPARFGFDSAGRQGRLRRRLSRLVGRLSQRGVLSVAILRNVPVAPYAVVNVACGMTPVGFVAFIAGTLLGFLPGVVLAGFFGQELGQFFSEPSLGGALRIAGVVAAMLGLATLADRTLGRRAEPPDGEPE